MPVLAELLFAASMLCEFTAFIPYLVDCYLPTAASALAAGMASRSLVGGIFPLFAVQWVAISQNIQEKAEVCSAECIRR